MGKLKSIIVSIILSYCFAQSVFSQNPAPRCPTASENVTCELPSCRCSSSSIPGNLLANSTPQIVFLTFDNAITVSNYPLYEEILFNRKNPNNASISATFFISHEYNSYSLTHQLWRRGHEIALNSITRFSNTQYWLNLNESMWKAEIVDQRQQMAYLANIPITEVSGMRAPFLQIGGNVMYKALADGNLTWECSRPTLNNRKPGLWPYTNDYLSTQDCQLAPCPNQQFKGFWTVPMIDMIGLNSFPCTMIDSCEPRPETANETYQLLKTNFDDQYNGNRAPYGVFTTAGWLIGSTPDFEERKKGFVMFLDYLGTLKDVFIVGISKGIEWIKNPTSLAQINNFPPWQLEQIKQDGCQFPLNCRYLPDGSPSERYMSSCVACPTSYPWLHNPLGN